MVDEEDYHFFGAPLVDESDVQPFQRSDPAATRSLPLHQQVITVVFITALPREIDQSPS